MPKTIKIKKGVDIKLTGAAKPFLLSTQTPSTYTVDPSDFYGVTPKMMVKEGDEVKAGTPLFYDKNDERIVFCSPVSGEVAEVVRGDKRKILGVRILADKKNSFLKHEIGTLDSLSGQSVKDLILKSGLWPFIVQRPYGIVANPEKTPKSIFISGFDSSPLAPDYNFILKDSIKDFQTGINALAKLTLGKVHLGLSSRNGESVLSTIKGVETAYFDGPHPAGNVGVQIHHTNPVNKGDTVWTVNAQDVVFIGRFFTNGTYNVKRTVAVTGSRIKNQGYVETFPGAPLTAILADNLETDGTRVISGNVLTGKHVAPTGNLGFYHNQITAIPEGNSQQFLGWLAPNFHKFSVSRAYFSWLFPKKAYDLNANMNGEERAFVVSGQYEDVLPMDIFPVHLLKAIMVEDLDAMENLGIFEVTEEDVALCEYVCTSKIPVQETLRKGLALAHKELG